jgi:tetratricopeptide (TPR) repeat protein
LRPQPIGVFPGTAGFLLLPSVPEGEQLLPLLLRGFLPGRWPDSWRFFAAAVEGQNEEAVAELLTGDSAGAYNRFILMPNETTYASAERVLEGEERLLLDAAAWRFGFRSSPPPLAESRDEVRAFLLASHAYDAFQQEDWRTGLDVLLEAAHTVRDVSPVFSARLYAEWAATRYMLGDDGDETINGYRTALKLLEVSSFDDARAELWFQLGTALQATAGGRKSMLVEAVNCYQEALKIYKRDTYPESYAMVHMNLALAYLAMPATDRSARLRTAVAIQSLRETLRIYTKESYPELWASATLNLANALQHVKTSHQEDNLWEAVALYEDVLTVRRPEDDPVAYARLLANQGNALAHLGAFSRAVPRLEQARAYFEEHGEYESAEAVDAVLAEIEKKRLAHS